MRRPSSRASARSRRRATPSSRSTDCVSLPSCGGARGDAAGSVPKSTGAARLVCVVPSPAIEGISTNAPIARACASLTTSSYALIGAHHTSCCARIVAHSSRVWRPNISSKIATSASALRRRSRLVLKRSSARSSVAPSAFTIGSQCRSASAPMSQSHLPSAARYEFMSGFCGRVRDVGGITLPRARNADSSMLWQNMPVRSSDVDTSCPRPVRSRCTSAPRIPATSAMAVTLSPMPPGSVGGTPPGGVARWLTPLRAENAAMSKPGASLSGPVRPYPVRMP